MCVMDAVTFQRGDDAIVFSHVRHRSNAHAIHPAAGDLIVAHEHLAVGAALESVREPLRVGGVAECACLYVERCAYLDRR